MYDPRILTVIIGITGALLGVYFREQVREAVQRKKIAARLEAYLDDWLNDFLEDDDLQLVMEAASVWLQKEIEALQISEGAFLDTRKEYRDKLSEVEKMALDKKIGEGLYREIKALPDFEIEQRLAILREAKEGLLKNTLMISDDDAAVLSWIAVKRIVIIRANACDILTDLANLLEYIQKYKGDEDELIKKSSSVLFEITKSMIEITKNMAPLHKYATTIRKSNIFLLIFRK